MTDRPPSGTIEDWSTDWDHADPAWAAHAPEIWEDLRGRCPVAHTDRYGSAWLLVNHDDCREVLLDPESFSSDRVVISTSAIATPAPPITYDPPAHAPIRKLLLPYFSQRAVARLEGFTRARCRELLASIGDRTEVDAATEYAEQIPAAVIALLLGLPADRGEDFRRWIEGLLEEGLADASIADTARQEMNVFFGALVEERRRTPGDDLISLVTRAQVDGGPLTDEEVIGAGRLLLLAGLDTTWSAIGSSLLHLANNPDDRRRLVDDPSLLPTAVEELLRAFSPVSIGRVVKRDIDFHGHLMRAGEMALVALPAANRDPRAFERAGEVVIDRQPNRHLAFGVGIHRCLGAHLARMELEVALEEWLAIFPEFELLPDSEIHYSVGHTRGPRNVPVHVSALRRRP